MAALPLPVACVAGPVLHGPARTQATLALGMSASALLGRPARLAMRQCHVAAVQAVSPSGVGVRAAKREEEMKEIRGMTTGDIEQAVMDLKGELFLLRARQATRLEFKPSEFGRIRKRIAQMLTVRRERELAENIDKRQSRKLERSWRKSVVPRPPPSYNPDDWKK